jgi:hypothetical protein
LQTTHVVETTALAMVEEEEKKQNMEGWQRSSIAGGPPHGKQTTVPREMQ